jgi:hypothetical protein
MIYIIHANKYKFYKLVDFLIPLFSYICTFIHLHYIYYTYVLRAYLGFWVLLYDTTSFLVTLFWRLCMIRFSRLCLPPKQNIDGKKLNIDCILSQ